MKRNLILIAVVCLFATAFARIAAAQESKLNGNWTATIHAPDKTTTETWTMKVDSEGKITGTAKGDKGELPLSGTVNGTVFRGLVTDGDQHYQVHLTLDGDDMDGTIRMGKNEYLLMLKKK